METQLTPAPTASVPTAAMHEQRMMALSHAYLLIPQKAKLSTQWEQLTCVGFNPQTSRLEAVIQLKQNSGYSGSLCSSGSQEYVRFFVDWGSGFEDAGLTSFKAADINDGTPRVPICHAVSTFLNDGPHRRDNCHTAAIPRVRAILSWNVPPTAGNPDFVPVYGNVLTVHVQLQPARHRHVINLASLLHKTVPKLPKPELINLHPVYKKAGVPDHRTLYPIVQPMLNSSQPLSMLTFKHKDFSQLKVNLEGLVAELAKPVNKANVTYEELTCVGLCTETDTLGAVFKVKKPYGYNGDLCHTGSTQYVAFWADWDRSGTFDEYLGTASVQLHDIANLPAEGLYYGVNLHVNLAGRLKKCDRPNVVGIRAVLSWGTPPSTTNPNRLNYWGNRLDAEVQLRPSTPGANPSDPYLYTINDVSIKQIDQDATSPTRGLAFPTALLPSGARPFGNLVTIGGAFSNSGASGSVFYKVEYQDVDNGGTYQPITDRQVFQLQSSGLTTLHTQDSVNGWFSYLPTQSPLVTEKHYQLITWNTIGRNGLYRLRLSYTTDNPSLVADPAVSTMDVGVIYLDNRGFTVNHTPSATLHAEATLDFTINGSDQCQFIHQGNTVTGALKVSDQYFDNWNLRILPSGASLASYTCQSLTDTGNSITSYSFEADQAPCGYVLQLEASDRAILGFKADFPDGSYILHYGSHSATKYLGFAILP